MPDKTRYGYAIALGLVGPAAQRPGYAIGLEFTPDVEPPETGDSQALPGGQFPTVHVPFSGAVHAGYWEAIQASPGGVFPALGFTTFSGTLHARYAEYALAVPGGIFPAPQLPAFSGSLASIYDSRVDRLGAVQATGLYQQASGVSMFQAAAFGQASRSRAMLLETAEQSASIVAATQLRMQQAQGLRNDALNRFQLATPVRSKVGSHFENTQRLDAHVTSRAQQAASFRESGQYHWQIAIMLRGAWVEHYQDAGVQRHMGMRVPLPHRNSPGYAIALEFAPEFIAPRTWGELQPWLHRDSADSAIRIRESLFKAREQESMSPPPAPKWINWPPGPVDPPGPQPEPDPIVVAIRKVYYVLNSISLTRVEGDIDLTPLSFSAELDCDSWTWTWSATLPERMGQYLGRQANGEVPVVVAHINGHALHLRLESKSLDERFNPVRWRVSGRGINAILASPHAPTMSFTSDRPLTSQQLAASVLSLNGVPIGWGLDWQIPSWNVPAGVWAHSGSYIDAINDIASAAGGYVQPDMTEQVLRVLPRYPALPWDWHEMTERFNVPAGAAEVRGTDFVEKPNYNSVWVGGETAGVRGFITRAGTAGDEIAEQFLHPLITAPEAQLAKGGAILADTGLQEHVQVSWQVFPETGLILPGQFVRQRWPDGAGRSTFGISRRIAIQYDFPKLRQIITLETHPNV